MIIYSQSKSEAVTQLRKDLINGLPEQIQSIKRIALVLEKWDEVLHTLNQIWVLWEVFNAVKVKARAQILMSQAELKEFLKAVLVGDDKVQQALAQIKTTEAQSKDNVARAEILTKMKTIGHFTVSCKVSEWVRNWYCEQAIDFGWQSISQYITRRDKLASINNMAVLLKAQGKLAEAEPLFREALSSSRRVRGDDHPETLASINNMAALLKAQGKLSESEPLYREALSSRRCVLGDDHPDSLGSINNMAALLEAQCKLGEAEPLYHVSLSSGRRVVWG